MHYKVLVPDLLAALTAEALLAQPANRREPETRTASDRETPIRSSTDDDWAGGWYASARLLLKRALREAAQAAPRARTLAPAGND